jgi:hypothetical protein
MKVLNPSSIAWGYCQFSGASRLSAGFDDLVEWVGEFFSLLEVLLEVWFEPKADFEVVEGVTEDRIGELRGKGGGSGGTTVGFFPRGIIMRMYVLGLKLDKVISRISAAYQG